MVGPIAPATATPPTSLRDATEQAVTALLADLFTGRPAGRVTSVRGSQDVLVTFPGAAPPTDAEYLVVRTPPSGSGLFAQTVGVVRIAEVQGETARGVVLWSESDPRPGDQVIWPPRITIVLLLTETGDAPELASRARRLDSWIELELVRDRRLRLVRADTPGGERWRFQRLQEEREYGLTIAPLLVESADGLEVILRVRSIFTGQTLAQRQAVSKTVVSRPSPLATPATPAPLPTASQPPPPRGSAIRSVQPEPAIKRVEQSPDRMSVELPHSLKALALGDVDGDGRPEIVGITDRQVVVYRWTGTGVAPLATGGTLLDVFTTYVHVDTGDLDGDGKAEIVLTAIDTVPRGNRMENRLVSALAALRQGRLEYLVKDLERYLRVLHMPGKPPLLLAQTMGLYEPFEGPMEVVEWKDGRYRRGVRFPVSSVATSLYAFGSGDLDGDGRDELAVVSADGGLRIYDEQGRLRRESEDDLGQVEARGFAQTPRFPDYRGRSFDATAEQLAVWRAIPRRVRVTAAPGTPPEVVTVSNPGAPPLRASSTRREDQGVRGRAVGYGWDAAARQFAKRWESADFTGRALDFAVGDLGDGRTKLVGLSGVGEKRFLEVFTLYDRPSVSGDPGRGP